MKIQQLSLFLENKPGQLSAPCQAAGRGGHQHPDALAGRHAAVRHPAADRPRLGEGQGRAGGGRLRGQRHRGAWPSRCADRPGGLAEVLEVLEQASINIEYMYAFTFRRGNKAVLVFRFDDPDARRSRLLQAEGHATCSGAWNFTSRRRRALRCPRRAAKSGGEIRDASSRMKRRSPSRTASGSRRDAAPRRAAAAAGRAPARLRRARGARAVLPGRASPQRASRRTRIRSPRRPAPPAVHDQGRPARPLPARLPGRAARAGRALSTAPPARRASRPSSPTRAEDLETWADLCARFLVAGGLRPEHTVQVAFGYGLFTGGFGLHYGIERVGAAVVPAGRRQHRAGRSCSCRTCDAEVLICTPSYALHIAEVAARAGHRPRDALPLRTATSAASRGPRTCARASRTTSASWRSTTTA